METIDLEFQATPHAIAAYLIVGPDSPVLVETGPSSTLPTLLARLSDHGVRPEEVRDVLVTHIHLDHAGAAGWWARQGARNRALAWDTNKDSKKELMVIYESGST
ncbi:MAG: MBL fold metallo-hydrolase, partial [Actinomycetia bacterium]|nr:MBL fold metallo-hydrolase [Actinomycetes bacterium]